MKKTRVLSFIAAMSLAATSFGLSAFAADGDPVVQTPSDNEHSISITKKDDEAHTFEAYQLFKGTLTGESKTDKSAVMTGIEWGANVDKTKIKAAINGNATVKAALEAYNTPDVKFADPYEDAALFAAFISAKSGETGFANAIADVFAKALTDGDPAKSATVAAGSTATKATLTGLTTGYYRIKDQDGSLAGKNGAYSDFILQLVNNVDVNAKADAPSIDKKITDANGENEREGDTASIGDKIYYELQSAVPDMDLYETYYFIAGDTMSSGLSFDGAGSVTVSIDGKELDNDAFYVNVPGRDGKTFEVVLKNFIQYKAQKGKDIEINYTATLNEGCDRTLTGNPNTVDLLFANDPNATYTGKPNPDNPDEPNNPDEPGPNDPTGKTPPAQTKVFTTGIRVLKVDENGDALSGAKFKLTGAGTTAVISLQSKFEEDEAGTYYKLKNGTYTTTAYTAEKAALYDSNAKYKLVEDETSVEMVAQATNAGAIEAYVDKDGYLVFSGLGDGEYKLQETEAPNGYNIDPTVYDIKITSTPTFDTPNWKVGGAEVTPSADNAWTVLTKEIINKKGIILPATGGIGTVIFYVVGSLLIAGAAVLFVTKKKRNAAK